MSKHLARNGNFPTKKQKNLYSLVVQFLKILKVISNFVNQLFEFQKSEKVCFECAHCSHEFVSRPLLEIHTRVKQSVIEQALCETEVVVERVVERLRL